MLDIQLTPNFNIYEFRSNIPNRSTFPVEDVPEELFDNVQELAENLQILSDHIDNQPIKVLSGYRSPAYNQVVGGAKNSQHLYARAADIIIPHLSPKKVHSLISELIKQGLMKDGGLGKYPGFTHYDVRDYSARW